MVRGQRCSQQCTQGIKWSGGAAVCRTFNWKDTAEIILSAFVHQKGSLKGRVSQEDALSFCLKSPKRSQTLWGEINGEPRMLGMRWEGQRSNSLELTCCCSIASLPITSSRQSRELYQKSEWISPLKTHLRACSLRRRVTPGSPCSTFAHSPFHSHSAYWKYLVSWREWTCGHTGASPTLVRRCCVCSSAILVKEAQIQRQTEGKCMFVAWSSFSFAVSLRDVQISCLSCLNVFKPLLHYWSLEIGEVALDMNSTRCGFKHWFPWGIWWDYHAFIQRHLSAIPPERNTNLYANSV